MKEREIITKTLKHFPKKISNQTHEFVIENVLEHSRYIFTKRIKGGQQYGYCTYCHKTYKTDNLKHKEYVTCKKCLSDCQVQSAGMGRKHMKDEAYIVYYEKSQADANAIIARGFNVVLDYSGEYKNVRPRYTTLGKYLFQENEAVFLKRNSFRKTGWELRKSVFSLYKDYGHYGFSHNINETSIKSIEKAVKGTPFQYSAWDYRPERRDDYTKFFELYTKYKQVEYLNKLGFNRFVEARIDKLSLNGTINWSGKTINEVLKVPKENVKELIKESHNIDIRNLKAYQESISDGSKLSIQEIRTLQHELSYLWDFVENAPEKNIRQMINYLTKQLDQVNQEIDPEAEVAEDTIIDIALLLRDYWRGCKRLNLVPGEDIVLYPRDVVTAHNNIYKQMKFITDKENDEKIKERLNKLNKHTYKNHKYIIRPLHSSKEVINEGKALNHCVGNYIERYANGGTDLFVIRRQDAPDKPFYTLEMKDGEFRQCYGKRNKKMTTEVAELVEQFKNTFLEKEKSA